MKFFEISGETLAPDELRRRLEDPSCGGYVAFEGWVRNNADGHNVNRLEYEAYESLAVAEGNRVLDEAIERFGVTRAACVHRKGVPASSQSMPARRAPRAVSSASAMVVRSRETWVVTGPCTFVTPLPL